MIQLNNLTKVYRSNNKKNVRAIDDVTLTLPSKGMIFVTGKSGSGKSTLLNMIGTLDNITSGDIVVDGHKFSKMKEKDFQEYRSSYLGFIFQDFLLLEEFTVYENVELALNISSESNEEQVKDILKRVGLQDMDTKFPTELSGGQKQRVAIARALVKNPKMILCDEPTGNLDYMTSKQVLDILKKESKDKLVLIVSHNLEDAEKYADRIIELSDGKVLHDNTKNDAYVNEFADHGSYVILPHHKDLTSKEVNYLNNKVKEGKFKVIQNKGGFNVTKFVDETPGEFNLQSSHISINNSVRLSKMFYRKNKHGIPYTILITTLMISLFYIFQVFITFDGYDTLVRKQDPDNPMYISLYEETQEGTLANTKFKPITDETIQAFYDAGYEGNIYKIYNYFITFRSGITTYGAYNRFTSFFNYNQIAQTLGTLCCDKEYLESIYGNLDEIVIAGSIEEADCKLIMTDYLADTLIQNTKLSYSDYEGLIQANKKSICAIINTGYKERYKNVINHGMEAREARITTDVYFEKYKDDPEHLAFLQEIQTSLGLTYMFSDDLYSSLKESGYYKTSYLVNCFYELEDGTSETYDHASFTYSDKIGPDEFVMNYALYNELFHTQYTTYNFNEFTPHKITIKKYADAENKEIFFEKEITITAIGASTIAGNNLYYELLECGNNPYCLVFDDNSNIDLLNEVSKEHNLYVCNIDTAVVPVINTILSLFKVLCLLIITLLFVATFIYIVFYGINSIKRNIYEIGVLKALGAKIFDIGRIFMLQIALLGFAISVFSIVGIIIASDFSNFLLVNAFEDFLSITIFGLKIIGKHPDIISIDLTLVFVLTVISSIIPLIYLRALKPLNILKGRNKK